MKKTLATYLREILEMPDCELLRGGGCSDNDIRKIAKRGLLDYPKATVLKKISDQYTDGRECVVPTMKELASEELERLCK